MIHLINEKPGATLLHPVDIFIVCKVNAELVQATHFLNNYLT